LSEAVLTACQGTENSSSKVFLGSQVSLAADGAGLAADGAGLAEPVLVFFWLLVFGIGWDYTIFTVLIVF
jgi:hypothetical protein